MVKQEAPGLRRIFLLASHSVDPEAFDNLPEFESYADIWGEFPRNFEDPERVKFFRKRKKAGDQIHWYIHAYVQLNNSGFRTKSFFWSMAKYQIDGLLFWCVNNWWYVKQYPDGEFYYDFPIGYAAGDGVLFWPGKDGPLDSIRWELIRDGMEDLEYRWVLQQNLKQLETLPLSDIDREIAKNARQALGIHSHFISSPNNYSGNPMDIYRARENLAISIEATSQILDK